MNERQLTSTAVIPTALRIGAVGTIGLVSALARLDPIAADALCFNCRSGAYCGDPACCSLEPNSGSWGCTDYGSYCVLTGNYCC
jgi:hypothetical protein